MYQIIKKGQNMQIQLSNNYNSHFGSKVITTPGANNIMNSYSSSMKKYMKERISELESNGNKDVVLIDACANIRDIFMTVYNMVNGKLCQGEFPTRVGGYIKSGFSWAYESSSDNPKPIKKSVFDKYNPLWQIIEDSLKKMDNVK